MKVWPVLLDSEPAYLDSSASGVSLLFTPMGVNTLASQLCQQLERITAGTPTIIAPAGARANYRTRMHEVCPSAVVATTIQDLADVLAGAETCDLLLFVDPRCLPIDASQLATLTDAAVVQPQVARHLVAFAAEVAGTKERVNVDGDGLVRSVDRYYAPAAWGFIVGVAASLVPVSSGILPLASVPASLQDLRQQLVSCGVPSQDVAIRDGAFDLGEEHGMLGAVERYVLDATDAAQAAGQSEIVLVGDGHLIHPTARLLGPIVIQSDVRIDPDTTVVGPTLIGAGSRIASGALVAHVAVGAYTVVPQNRVVCDRVWVGSVHDEPGNGDQARVPSYSQRLARLTSEPQAADAAALDEAPGRYYPLVKRAFDATVAAISLLVLTPLLLPIAALVWFDSRGSVFFTHTREGVGGTLFNCLKFRTMRVGTNEMQRRLKSQDKLDGPHFKLESDPRITRVGHWLRATNVDELPQLVNVLVGDMSLVGPRPSPFRENQICVPWRAGRLSVRPGITGLWQVCRQDRAAGDFHQWIEYDLLYVQHMSLLLDLKVLAVTLFTLGGKFPAPVSWLVRPSDQTMVHAADTASRGGPRRSSTLVQAESSQRSAP